MSEQLREDQVTGDCCAVHADEGTSRPPGSPVNSACNQLLACSRFARDENRRIARRNFGDAREYTLQSGGGSNNLFKHRGLVDFFTESGVLQLELLLGSFAFINIRGRNIPAHDLSLVVAHRIVASQKPAIASIMLAQPQLHLVSRATCQSTIPASLDPFRIIRVGLAAPARLPPLVKPNAEIIERHAVGVKTFEIGSEYSNELRCEVKDLPEFRFTSAQFLLCSFTLSDVDHSAHKFNEMAGRAQNRMTYDVNVPDGAIRMHNAVVRLPLCLLADSRLD